MYNLDKDEYAYKEKVSEGGTGNRHPF